jgi:hypothetical protein
MADGLNWQEEVRPMFRTMIFRAVLNAPDGMKLSAIRDLAGEMYGTLTQLFRELDEMVAVGQLSRDEASDNTYRASMTAEEYCEATGESIYNLK